MNIHGKINKNGVLEIKRGSIYKKMECKHSTLVGFAGSSCCDVCSRFGEPNTEFEDGGATLTICDNKTLFFKEFIDERL